MNAIIRQINSLGSDFVEFALPMLLQVSVLILILLLADLVLRKKVRAVFRYWIWMLVLLKLVLPVSLSSPLSLGYFFGDKLASVDIPEPTAEVLPAPVEPLPADLQNIIDIAKVNPGFTTMPVTPIVPPIEPPVTTAPAVPTEPAVPVTWQGVVFLLWLAVVSAMGLLLLQRAMFVRGLVSQAKEANGPMKESLRFCRGRLGFKSDVELKISASTTSPAVCGLLRPVILMPQHLTPTLDSANLQVVLMHELAHIKRRDLWVNLAQTILQIVYFYNPLLWLANAIIRRVREQAVDEAILVAMGEKAQQYPQALVNVAKLAFKRPALGLRLIGVVESKGALSRRIKHILNHPIPKTAKLGILGLFVIIITAAILLPMAGEKVEIGEGSEREMTLTLGWSGEKVKIPAPVVLPEWGRKTREFESWKLGTVYGDITVFDIDDYKYVAQAAGRKKNLKDELNTVLYSIKRYRPNGTLEAYTSHLEADGAPTEWRTYNEDGSERMWAINRPTASDCKRKVIFYGPDGKETKKWQVSEFDVVYAEFVTDPNGRSYFSHYEKELIHSPYPETFVARLTNGITVELIGVCEHPSEAKQWWRPDGSLLAQAPYDQLYVTSIPEPKPNERVYEFAYRLSSDMDVIAISATGEVIEHGGMAIVAKKNDMPTDISSSINYFPKDQKTTTLSISSTVFKNVSLRPGVKTDVQVEGEERYFTLNAREVLERFIVAVKEKAHNTVTELAWPELINANGLREFQALPNKQDIRINFITADSNAALAISSGIKSGRVPDDRFFFWLTRKNDAWLVKNVELKAGEAQSVPVEEFCRKHPLAHMIPHEFKGPIDLPSELFDKRNQLLAEADEKIRAGLAELAERFPQLTKSSDLQRSTSGKSTTGHIRIYLRHRYGGKGGNSPVPVPEEDSYSVAIIVRPPPQRPEQLSMGPIYPSLRLVGQIGTSAGAPELDAALKKMVKDALEPLRKLEIRTQKPDVQVKTKRKKQESSPKDAAPACRHSVIARSVGAGSSSGAYCRQLSEVVVLCYSFMYVPGALQVLREDHHIPRAEANRIRTV